jgi:hypothetical protein
LFGLQPKKLIIMSICPDNQNRGTLSILGKQNIIHSWRWWINGMLFPVSLGRRGEMRKNSGIRPPIPHSTGKWHTMLISEAEYGTGRRTQRFLKPEIGLNFKSEKSDAYFFMHIPGNS